MCFSSPKIKSADPVPTPAPSPTPIGPTDIEAQVSQSDRKQKLARLRAGLASTIKTSSKGIPGSGQDLLQATIMGKDKLGA